MSMEDAAIAGRPSEAMPERFFTVEAADEALVLVRPVLQDVVDTYNELMRLRSEQQELTLVADAHEQLEELGTRIEDKVARLKRLVQELADVGCELKDASAGLVDFPARVAGRKVLLCWQLGESEVSYWHELRGGFAGRRPIDTEFRRRAGEPLVAGTDSIGLG